MKECIDRKKLLQKINTGMSLIEVMQAIIDAPIAVPEATTGNEVNLCESCENTYPECPKNARLIFGDGRGNDNICACSEYKPLTKREWAKCDKEEKG